MNDDNAMVARIVQEAFPDPAQIAAELLVELYSRPHSGMNEQIITETEGVCHVRQKLNVRGRNLADEPVHDFHLTGIKRPAWIHSVALRALRPAVRQPGLHHALIAVEHGQEELFVISLQEHGPTK